MVSSCEMEYMYLDMIKHEQPAFHKYQRKMERVLMLSKYAHVNRYTLSNKKIFVVFKTKRASPQTNLRNVI